MKTEVINLQNKGVTLTTYLLDSSPEMSHLSVRPAVLICPGGAYKFCSDREAEPIAMHFCAMGFHAFILRYSLNEASAFPTPLNDAEEALSLIRENAEKWFVDPQKIAACGFSAGGHLAAALGTMGKVRPNALILGYPCISEDVCESDVLYCHMPALYDKVDALTPASFIFATSPDDCVPVGSSLKFSCALAENKIPFSLHIFPEGGHGLATSDYVTCKNSSYPNVALWLPLCKDFLYKLFFKENT